ncbi:MAG: sensor histidine kinase [Niastella sp.]|nr:sensor histidine kinase [Niastella sp.]
MRYTLIILWFLLLATNSGAQDPLDRLLKLPDDTAKVNQLNHYALSIQSTFPQKAIPILNHTADLSRKLNYDYGLATSKFLRSGMYFYIMKLDSSSLLLDEAFGLLAGKTDKASKDLYGSLLMRKANLFQQHQSTDSAIYYYLQAATNYADKRIIAYYNISGIYRSLNDTSKTLAYARQTHSIALEAKDSVFLLRSLIVLGDAFVLAGKRDSVWTITQTGMPMAEKLNMPFATGMFHAQLGYYYSDSAARYDSALSHYRYALDIFTAYNLQFEQALALQHLGNVSLKKGDYTEAIGYLKKATTLARQLDLNQVLFYTLKDLSVAFEKTGNLAESNQYLRELLAVNDTLQQRNNQKTVMELEAKYQMQKKEAYLAVQQKDIQEKKFTIWFLLLGLVTLTIISLLLYRNYRHKQKLQQVKIEDLESEKQLAATEAVLKGEEQERARLAKDLHDGLGGMLSGIKHSLNAVKGTLAPDNAQVFERNIDMLDSSIKEMRRVAHNMMPEALVKFGLDTALKDFCNDINQSGALQVTYHSIGMDNTELDRTTSITIYRIVQELLNNVIKHAETQNAIVQVSKNGNIISVTVEDDGKGFDTKILEHKGGIGWRNIQSRVDYLKGKLDIRSERGKGTSVWIEFNAGA